MKKKLLAFLLMLTVVASLGMAQGKWRLNPYTGKLDYYEPKAGLATLASPSFTGTVKSAGPLEVGPVGRNLKVWWNFEDFLFGPYTTTRGPVWKSDYSGTGAMCASTNPTAQRLGIQNQTTGTTTTGYSTMYLDSNVISFLFGGGIYTFESDINLPSLSTVTETYVVRVGFMDFGGGVAAVDGAYFEYSDAGSTPNWYKCTASNSSRTNTDTGVSVSGGANVWTRLKVVVNAAGTSVEYFINGTSAGVVTTNIPTGAGRFTSCMMSILKSAGTTACSMNIDWTWIHIDLAASR